MPSHRPKSKILWKYIKQYDQYIFLKIETVLEYAALTQYHISKGLNFLLKGVLLQFSRN